MSRRRGALWLTAGVFVLGLLFVPLPDGHFHMTMLDVGQGDSIFLHAGTGQNMLVDGGSTSVSGVGEYRILPFLKYCGVRQLDYVVMTHDDEDHVNGLLAVLEESGRGGPVVKNLLVPDLADRPDEGGRKLTALARERKIPVTRLSAGDTLRAGDLLMTCLNPVKQLRTESANAGSITLSLRFQGFSCLLTGDLEGEGQEQVKRILERDRERYLLPSSYTVLKVAHHGSKNSSDEEFLRLVSPQLSLISCGKNNRYGHPHRELLERLHATGARVYLTPQHGAVSLRYDGAAPEVEWRRPDGEEKKINDK